MSNINLILSKLPSVEKILKSQKLQEFIGRVGHDSVRDEARLQLSDLRQSLSSGDEKAVARLQSSMFLDEFSASIAKAVEQKFSSTLIPVFNLTGTVVHTNLGRASLPEEAVSAMVTAATGPCNLEFDLDTGKRGDRDSHLEKVICELTGAEAVTVVNNNAAAVLLVLNTLAQNKGVIVSRGELVEIGGAFRIPDVMKSAGSTLVEVGTTNRTHLRDYQSAISEDTGLLMKVHTSNYEIRGFTNSVSEEDIARLARESNIPFVYDLGSGSLLDLSKYGLPGEPTVQEILALGADVLTFSGDKLLGGPQAGIILGKKELIEKIKANPLKRALRIDKVTLAALLQVLYLYKDPKRIKNRLPLLADLTRPVEEIEALVNELLPAVESILSNIATVEKVPCKSQIGSGALPLDLMESCALSIKPKAKKGETDRAVNFLAKNLRKLSRPIIGRISDGKILLDLRCLRDKDLFLEQLNLLEVK